MKLAPAPLPVNSDIPTPLAKFLVWAGGGAGGEFPNAAEAIQHARLLAARNPGRSVGVYQRIGFVHQPLVVPDFVVTADPDHESAAA